MTMFVVGTTVLATATALLALLKREAQIPAPVTIINFGLLLILGLGVFTYIQHEADQDDYDACIARVDRSYGNRAYNLVVIGVIDREVPGSEGIQAELTDALNEFLPALDYAACGSEP